MLIITAVPGQEDWKWTEYKRQNNVGPHYQLPVPTQNPESNDQPWCDPQSSNHANNNLHRWLTWLKCIRVCQLHGDRWKGKWRGFGLVGTETAGLHACLRWEKQKEEEKTDHYRVKVISRYLFDCWIWCCSDPASVTRVLVGFRGVADGWLGLVTSELKWRHSRVLSY